MFLEIHAQKMLLCKSSKVDVLHFLVPPNTGLLKMHFRLHFSQAAAILLLTVGHCYWQHSSTMSPTGGTENKINKLCRRMEKKVLFQTNLSLSELQTTNLNLVCRKMCHSETLFHPVFQPGLQNIASILGILASIYFEPLCKIKLMNSSWLHFHNFLTSPPSPWHKDVASTFKTNKKLPPIDTKENIWCCVNLKKHPRKKNTETQQQQKTSLTLTQNRISDVASTFPLTDLGIS